MGGLNVKEGIIHYYLFQKIISKYFNKIKYKEDETELKVGYLINSSWMKYWRNSINYEIIKKHLDELKISKNNLDKYGGNNQLFIQRNINEEAIKKVSNTVITHNFDITHKSIFSQKFLMNFMEEEVLKSLKINSKITKIEIQYLLKKKMMIFVLKDYHIIKIIIPDISDFSDNKNVVNLSWKFYDIDTYYYILKILRENNSKAIINYLLDRGVFANPIRYKMSNNKVILYSLINEDMNYQAKYTDNKKYYEYYSDGNADTSLIIKQPKDINFDFTKRICFRGLDNVGATCYMNATLQCLANIKPVTDYLLNVNKYCEIYDNAALCSLTLQYCQVLLGLFCDKLTTGSYSPKLFKMVIGEMNPLFQGVQANDSKDLIIFLLEILNTELTKLHNKKHNNKKKEMSLIPNIDSTNQDAVLKEFLNTFKISHSSVIGDNLCGFQKNVFMCQKCSSKTINFNLFNFLIFGLEATAKYFNINNVANPILKFDHCFQFLSKGELFQDTYCQKCKNTGISKYKESIYLIPNYLIIILNRGKGNIFKCTVDIPLIFDSSNYEERDKNKKYELIGIVSHFGESGMGGHFIAFCKHNMDNKWRCYNDSVVTECQNDFLNKGTPYILFYKYMNKDNNYHSNTFIKQNNINSQNNSSNNNINPVYNKNISNNNTNIPFNNQQQNMMMNQGFYQNMNNINNFQGVPCLQNNFQGNFISNNQNFIQNMNLNNNNNNFQNNMGMNNINMNNINMFNMPNMNNNF